MNFIKNNMEYIQIIQDRNIVIDCNRLECINQLAEIGFSMNYMMKSLYNSLDSDIKTNDYLKQKLEELYKK